MSDKTLQQLEMQVAQARTAADRLHALLELAASYDAVDRDKLQAMGEEALNLAEALGDSVGMAGSLLLLGKHAYHMNDYATAYRYASMAHDLYTQHGDATQQLSTLQHLVLIAERTGNVDVHLELTLQAIALAQQLGDKRAEALAYFRLGNFHNMLDEIATAAVNYERAIAILGEMGDEVWQARISVTLGGTIVKLGQHDAALAMALPALEVIQDRIEPIEVAIAYGLVGRIYAAMQRYDDALVYFQRKLVIAETLGNQKARGFVLCSIGRLYIDTGRYDDALTTLQQSIAVSEAIGATHDLSRAHRYLVDVYKAQGNYPQAFFYLERLVEMKQRLFDEQADMRRKFLIIQHETQQAQLEAQYHRERAEEAERRAAQDKAYFAELSKLREEFISSATHDLKNPLATIFTTVHIMRKKFGQSLVPYLDRIDAQAAYMRLLIANMLELAKLETKQAIHKAPTALRDLLEDLLRQHRPAADAQRITLQLRWWLESDDLLVLLDSYHMQRALNNLLSNALKYSENDGQVEVVVKQLEGLLCIQVVDQGFGIPTEALPRIFERFYRVDSAATAQVDGTGLGLSIVKTIVEQHDGEITVESEFGVGTTFTIHLPLLMPSSVSPF